MLPTVNLSSLNGSNGFRLDGAIGRVSDASDINGDGFDDVTVRGDTKNGINYGSSHVIFGKAANFNATENLSALDGSNGFGVIGELSDGLGASISNAGDFNGDGYDDLIIGAPNAEGNNDDDYYHLTGGSSYVLFGKSTGFGATFDLSNLDGANGVRIDGQGNAYSGSSVSQAGDINGDGFDDVIIGAMFTWKDQYSGSFYVVFGKSSGFDATFNLSSLDGSNGFSSKGTEYDHLGGSVGSAGDVNGDGFDDLIVGAWGADLNGINAGSTYVVFGKKSGFDKKFKLSSLDGSNGFRLDGTAYSYSGASVSSAGDVNGDGFDDVIIGAGYSSFINSFSREGSSYVVFGKRTGFEAQVDLSNLNGSNGFRIIGETEDDRLGISVSNAGDVNGDGYNDVIVGAKGTDMRGKWSGESYVVFGKASGFDATIFLSRLDGTEGFRLDGAALGNGHSVSTAGDVNNDGFDDLIVGGGYVIFGKSDFSNDTVISGTSNNDILKGTSLDDIFEAGVGDDQLIGLGGPDLFHAGDGNDDIKVRDLNFGIANGGAGNDVLHLDGNDLNLDLSSFIGKIRGIETICLYGRGDNTLTLNGSELKDLSESTNTLKLHGNAGDQVILKGKWIDEGVSGFYHTYTQDDAVLLVGMNMTAVVG